ncbi:uncharacterized protein LOC129587099 [Paramacrobiotus metropolitanus]|uniref:uncharacterized protein LOC129587099 n=1 Tax=Paramacrobiotus metropolitanus TaxID=2943436 RepID=UPI0024459CED|nr:uncharacterized protein LOC129587099 [Paramacrobiotus metropolitanus]
MIRTTQHFTTTITPLTPPPSDGNEYETLTFSSCADFLAHNLSLADLVPSQGNSTMTSNTDSCGFRILDHNLIAQHPVKYLYWVTYPLLLLICTVGNTLTLIVLSREGAQSVKWIFLMALAFSDLMIMWAQFFPWVAEIAGNIDGTGFDVFMGGFGGAYAFLEEMFLTSSDWILVAFSIERFAAIAFPVWYDVILAKVSRTIRAVISVVGIFTLAAVYSLWNLFDSYWFYYNDDKRCPVVLIKPPQYIKDWRTIYVMASIIVPAVNFGLILFLNSFVTLRLLYYRQFRQQPVHMNNPCGSQAWQATRMLFATAVVYCATQTFPLVFLIMRRLVGYPRCSYFINEDTYAKFARTNALLVNINYSINFLLYSLISTGFRQLLWKFITRKSKDKRVRWYHVFGARKTNQAIPLSTVNATDHEGGDRDDQERASINTQMSAVKSGWTIRTGTSLTDDSAGSIPGIPLRDSFCL